MNVHTKPVAGLDMLRKAFEPHHISKLPKETRAQIDARKADRNVAINCTVCGGWHHKNAVHLDYVGHAALTDRLLDTDLEWSWEPVAFNAEGLPAFDRNGGLWIKLTVLGVTRLGYGSADGKSGGDAVKEIIGDALRNAAMRFGAALDLWHKGDLHVEDEAGGHSQGDAVNPPPTKREKLAGPHTSATALQTAIKGFVHEMNGCGDADELSAFLHCKESLALIEQVKRDKPEWWHGGPDMPPEFVPLSRQIEMREYDMAQQIADLATV